MLRSAIILFYTSENYLLNASCIFSQYLPSSTSSQPKHVVSTTTVRLVIAHFKRVKLCLPTPYRHVAGVYVWLHSFLTPTLDGGEWLTSRPGRFRCGIEPRYLLNTRLGGLHSRYRGFLKRTEIISCPCRESKPAPSSQVTTMTSSC